MVRCQWCLRGELGFDVRDGEVRAGRDELRTLLVGVEGRLRTVRVGAVVRLRTVRVGVVARLRTVGRGVDDRPVALADDDLVTTRGDVVGRYRDEAAGAPTAAGGRTRVRERTDAVGDDEPEATRDRTEVRDSDARSLRPPSGGLAG